MKNCLHPDRHEPRLVCGYPLPCPHHTVTVDLGSDPPTVTIPLTSDAMADVPRRRIGQVVSGLVQIGDGNSMVIKRLKARKGRAR